MHTVHARLVPRWRTAAAAVVLPVALAAGAVLSGCEYVYDDGRGPLPGATLTTPTYTDAALPQDPRLNLPVTGPELDAWAHQVLPDTAGQVFHTSYGSVEGGVTRDETTGPLPSGTYALTLACKSPRRVSFTVRDGELALVDLSLRCGTSRVSVIHLSAHTLLSVQVAAQSAANYAYRVTRL